MTCKKCEGETTRADFSTHDCVPNLMKKLFGKENPQSKMFATLFNELIKRQ